MTAETSITKSLQMSRLVNSLFEKFTSLELRGHSSLKLAAMLRSQWVRRRTSLLAMNGDGSKQFKIDSSRSRSCFDLVATSYWSIARGCSKVYKAFAPINL
ncbi:unnamed protein product [Spodoptera exigua]|nr:unnamed protein product [Spodoptera exigua]